jgi:copper chaperone NosL
VNRLTTSVLLLLAIIAAGCSAAAEADGPPEISYGRDICLECNMIISEPRFAASYRLDDGETKSFDGIGELVKHAQRVSELDRMAFAWVHDFNTEEWILIEEAYFVAGQKIVTPMGHGIVAFTTAAAAEEFASGLDGMVMRWQEVSALQVTEDGLLGHNHE